MYGFLLEWLLQNLKTKQKQRIPVETVLRVWRFYFKRTTQFFTLHKFCFISMVISYSTLVQAQGLSNNTSFFSIFTIGCALIRLRTAHFPHSTISFFKSVKMIVIDFFFPLTKTLRCMRVECSLSNHVKETALVWQVCGMNTNQQYRFWLLLTASVLYCNWRKTNTIKSNLENFHDTIALLTRSNLEPNKTFHFSGPSPA